MFTTSDASEIEELLKTKPTKVAFEIGPNFEHLIDTSLWPTVDPETSGEAASGRDQFLAKYWLTGKSLDFGCGAGGAVLAAVEQGRDSFGYDIRQQWSDGPLSTNFDEAEQHGPYDTIMAFDVLDHLEGADVGIADHRSNWSMHIQTLKKLKNLLKSDGKLLIRCHPYCSANGTHGQKAFAHLVGRDTGIFTHKIIRPQAAYDLWFDKAGLKRIKRHVTIYELPPLLRQMRIEEKMLETWKHDDFVLTRERLEHVVRVQYIDFELCKS